VTDKAEWSLRAWLNHACARLGEAGVTAPRFDAERLAAHVFGVSWGELWTQYVNRPLDHADVQHLNAVLGRRASGEPLAYIEGSRVFHGIELECGPGVLVPRPETETLVDVVLELVDGVDSPVIADIGTGAGGIALAIATKRPDAEVIATDISEQALSFARRNAKRLDLDVWFASGDLLDALPSAVRGRVDVIASNPPYVPDGAGVPDDVRAEPQVAVFGGEIGNDLLERVVAGAGEWLRPGGALVMEIGELYQADVLPGAQVRNDHTDRPRVIWRRF
jgi:release factor glutamine methyltransferase